MKRTLLATLLIGVSAAVSAQTVVTPETTKASSTVQVVTPDSAAVRDKLEGLKAPLEVTAESVGSALSSAERQRLEALARQLTDTSLQRYNSDEAKKYEGLAGDMKRRADDIADEAMAQGRDKVLRFLGIDPKGDGNLYYFVSFSMPLELLRAYVLEAMWSGGTVVLRGVPPGKTLNEFVLGDLRSLVYGKGSSANLSLDPRMFDAYEVTAVPTIVYTEERKQFQCTGVETRKFSSGGKELTYQTCPPVDPSKFWKMSGAVTSDYALRSFIEQGATGAQAFHNALRKGMAPGADVPKSLAPFKGEWKDAVTPEEVAAGRQAIEEMRRQQSSTAK